MFLILRGIGKERSGLMLIQADMGIQDKLRILSDAAKYDVSCSSSGVARKGKKGGLGNPRITDNSCGSQNG